MRVALEQAGPDEVAPIRNSQPLFDERDRFVGYLVAFPGRVPFLTTTSCTPSEPLNRYGRPNKAHATRLRAVDRLPGAVIDVSCEDVCIDECLGPCGVFK